MSDIMFVNIIVPRRAGRSIEEDFLLEHKTTCAMTHVPCSCDEEKIETEK